MRFIGIHISNLYYVVAVKFQSMDVINISASTEIKKITNQKKNKMIKEPPAAPSAGISISLTSVAEVSLHYGAALRLAYIF